MAGASRDFLETEYTPHPSYLKYLDNLGIPYCTTGPEPAKLSSYTYVPFGWDEEAIQLSKKYARDGRLVIPHPSDGAQQNSPHSFRPLGRRTQQPFPAYTAVQKANDRKFLQELSEEEEPGETCFVSNPDVLNLEPCLGMVSQWLEEQPSQVIRVKSRHGHAGMGHYLLRPGENLPKSWVTYWKARRGVVVERQRQPVLNIGSIWDLLPDGGMENLCHHELMLSGDGSYRGAVLPSEWRPPQPARLLKKIKILNKRLYQEGYFGPVELDSFYYHDRKRELTLRAYVDCNARLTMLHPAYQYKKNLSPESDLLWKVLPAAKGKETARPDFWKPLYAAFLKAFPHGEVVIATPPLVRDGGGNWLQLPFVMAVSGEGEDVVLSVESSARKILLTYGL